MPTITGEDNKSRYRSQKTIRNQPKDELEINYRDSLVAEQVERLMDKFPNEHEFMQEVAVALGKRVLERRED
jgi:hypothetical protein